MKTQPFAGRTMALPRLETEGLAGWAAAGAVAGLAFVAATLWLRLLTGVPSLPEIVQDRLLALTPGALVSVLIDRLQFWGKPLLLAGWAVGQVALGALVGIVFGQAAVEVRSRGRRRLAGSPDLSPGKGHKHLFVDGAAVGLALWALVELAVLPLLGLGPLGARVSSGPASAGWSLLPFVGSGLLLVALRPLFDGRMRGDDPLVPMVRQDHHEPVDSAEESPVEGLSLSADAAARGGRRAFLRLAFAGGFTALAALAFWRVAAAIGERGTPATERAVESARDKGGAATGPTTAGAATETQGSSSGFEAPPGISAEVTPNDRFYVISKNLVDPTVSATGWSLQVTGLVNTPLNLAYDQVRALPSSDVYATLECISNEVGGELISNTRWTGVPLALVLDRAGVQESASWVVFTSTDGYQEAMPLERARAANGAATLLVHSMDGAPLPQKHGYPLRLVTTGRYGMKNPKWLTKIELATKPPTGYWEREGWNAENGVETMARFDTRPQRAAAGAAILLGGVAFAGDRGISRVEVSDDGGRTWSAASVKGPLSPFTWQLWSYRWQAGAAGSSMLTVRAVDGQGTPQKAERRAPHPTGATGYHAIHVEVI